MIGSALLWLTLFAMGSTGTFPDHVIPAEVVAIYDADTLTLDVHPWTNETRRLKIRIGRVDAPEIRGKCAEEREMARSARDLVTAWLGGRIEGRMGFSGALAPPIEVEVLSPADGKFAGRIIGDLRRSDGARLSAFLLLSGLARPYSGEARRGWCGV